MDWYYSADGKPVGPHSADDIESLFLTRQISADTLVWRKGLTQWAPLSETPEFLKHLDDELPPPLPPATPRAGPAVDDDILVDERIEANDEPRVDREPILNFSKASVAPHLAGPWTRYFARSIDLSIIASVLLTIIYWVLPSVNPKLYLQIYFVDPRAMFLILLPFAHFINAVIITLTGNSLGKAIFAAKAEPIDGRDRFGFGGNLAREFRVWTQGLALGIPILNLFTMVPAFRAVSKGAPAPYDFRIATVRAYSQSSVRRTLGILFGLSLYLGIAYLNAVDKMALEDLAQPTSWTNPATQITTMIPANWQYEIVQAPDGAMLYGFTNMKTGVVALLGRETAPNLDMTTYTTALARALAGTTPLGNWSVSTMPGVWKANGQMVPDSYPSTIYVTQDGADFWRIVYVDQLTTAPREIVEPEMSTALFGSAGVSVR